MRILAESEGRRIQFVLPTGLVFSGKLLRFCLKLRKWQAGKSSEVTVPDIPPEKLEILCAQIKRVKREHKRYELIDMVSSNGDHVNITL